MTPHATAVATVTLVRRPGEDTLLRNALTSLATLNVPVVVADGGSGDAFVQFVRQLPGFTLVLPERPGLVPQVKAAIRAACERGVQLVLYTESDKQEFFVRHLAQFLDQAHAAVEQGVVLASRSDVAYGTFPPVQRYTEGVINSLMGEFLEQPGDYSYGPMLMHRDIAAEVERAPDHLGWGWRHFALAAARRLRRRVSHVVGDYACPPGQRSEDAAERSHRLRQLAQNVEGLLAGSQPR